MINSPLIILRKTKTITHERGVALFVVIVFVLLSMLLALWASRSAFFNEILVSNDADYQRTFEAAQAMLQDAELDIRGVQPDGSLCNSNPTDPDSIDPNICRTGPDSIVYFDIETKELASILTVIENKNPTYKCFQGICSKRTFAQDFWNNKDILSEMTASLDSENYPGAHYGQFTGAKSTSTANPILANIGQDNDCKTMCAWYWVEIMPYMDPNIALIFDTSTNPNISRFAPSSDKLFVYRITALARGMKPGSEVVLQSTLSIQKSE